MKHPRPSTSAQRLFDVMQQLKRRMPRRAAAAIALLSISLVACSLCVHNLINTFGLFEKSIGISFATKNSHYDNVDEKYSYDVVMDEETKETIEDADAFYRRFLFLDINNDDGNNDINIAKGSSEEEASVSNNNNEPKDYNAAVAQVGYAESEFTPYIEPSSSSSRPLPHYTLQDALYESSIFESTFCIVIYDPPNDKFIMLYNKQHKWKAGNKKLWKAMREFTFMLRQVFPGRFTTNSPELVLPVASGDYPHVHPTKIPHVNGTAPVLMFGSAFRRDLYSNMIAMPMPHSYHLKCFLHWVYDQSKVCDELQSGSLNFGEEYGLLEDEDDDDDGWKEWNHLIPQLIWRGTDFGYLQTLQERTSRGGPILAKPHHEHYIQPEEPNRVDWDTLRNTQKMRRYREANLKTRKFAIQKMNDKIHTLLPRWKGVAFTADAELQAEGTDTLPWANIKFSHYFVADKVPTVGSDRYAQWESVGIATGEGMSLSDLAKYKYHIDLGGGGGTTWSGTIEKLAMPGLLFHHITPTRDYIHDHLRPWKHYVPVSTNLQDLKEKFDWAEENPAQAKRIANSGREFMKELGTPQGFSKIFEQDFVQPLRRVIEAYQPVASLQQYGNEDGVSSWRDMLRSLGDDCSVVPVFECTGLTTDRGDACNKLVDDDTTRRWDYKQSESWLDDACI